MALSPSQLAAGVGLNLPFAGIPYVAADASEVDEPVLIGGGNGYPVVILIDEPQQPTPVAQFVEPITAASRVEVANLAIVTKLGSDAIDSFDDDTKAASILTRIYDRILDQELSRHPWVFAIQREKLPASDAAQWGPFKYSFPLPGDFLTLARVSDRVYGTSFGSLQGFDEGEYAIEGSQLRTIYSGPLPILYIRRVLNTAEYHPLFIEVMACRLGREMAIPLTGSTKLWQKCAQEYAEAIAEAKRVNAIAKVPRQSADDSWLLARR